VKTIPGTLTLDAYKAMAASAKEMDRKVTVCSACLQASCWQGLFYCEAYKTAGTVQKTISELMALGLESPDYWKAA
jgi:hypothetical protein